MKITTYVLGAMLLFACSCKKENEGLLAPKKEALQPASELVLKENKNENVQKDGFETKDNPNPDAEPKKETPFDGYIKYSIPQGAQSALQSGLKMVSNDSLVFSVYFDSTAIYTSATPGNQADINKLWGFSDCSGTQHQNSARVGWRYFKGNLELLAYCYAGGVRSYKLLGAIKTNEFNTCTIVSKMDTYVFYLGNQAPIVMERGCSQGLKFRLFPYFGGDEVAPHDVNIWIKELN